MLSVTSADGTSADLAPAHETYIANGDLAGTVPGVEPKLEVRDEGTGPYGPQTRKAYLTFDLSELTAAPTKAVRLTITPTTKAASTAFATGANIRVIPADPGPLVAELKDGYYSPAFYTVSEAKYLSYTLKATGTARFNTLLLPIREGSDATAEVTRVHIGDGASALSLETDRGSGWYLHAGKAGSERTVGPYASDARVAYADSSSGTQRLLLAGGTVLLHHEEPLVRADRPLGTLAVVLDRDKRGVALSGLAGASSLEIAAPWARTVTVDGEPVRFEYRRGMIRVG